MEQKVGVCIRAQDGAGGTVEACGGVGYVFLADYPTGFPGTTRAVETSSIETPTRCAYTSRSVFDIPIHPLSVVTVLS